MVIRLYQPGRYPFNRKYNGLKYNFSSDYYLSKYCRAYYHFCTIITSCQNYLPEVCQNNQLKYRPRKAFKMLRFLLDLTIFQLTIYCQLIFTKYPVRNSVLKVALLRLDRNSVLAGAVEEMMA